MSEKELVLKIGVEGGGADLFRTPLDSGGWQFHVEGSSMYLDEQDNEEWRSWRSQPFLSIEEALRSVATDGSWVSFCPMEVHPEYRTTVWELAQDVASKLPKESRERWKRRSQDWQGLCYPSGSRVPGGSVEGLNTPPGERVKVQGKQKARTRKAPETLPAPGAIRVYGGKPSYYNGFAPKERDDAFKWLKQQIAEGKRILSTICEACGADKGLPHSEDYSEPFGDHIGAYILCGRCHKSYLHSIRYRFPTSWRRYLDKLRQQQGKETVLHEIDRGEIRRNSFANPSKSPSLPAELPPLAPNGFSTIRERFSSSVNKLRMQRIQRGNLKIPVISRFSHGKL